jgi:hypothetical protein
MFTTRFPGDDMVQREIDILFSTILTGISITPEDLVPGKGDLEPRTVDHMLQPDDRRSGKGLRHRIDLTSSVNHQGCAAGKDKVQRSVRVAYMDRLIIGI